MTAGWATAIAAITATVASGVQNHVNYISQKHLAESQEKKIQEAKDAQDKADLEAETERLEALAAEQTGGGRVEASDFGIDSALARRYLDENNKRQAKAQQMLEEEENPFYTRGLV